MCFCHKHRHDRHDTVDHSLLCRRGTLGYHGSFIYLQWISRKLSPPKHQAQTGRLLLIKG
ncbi:hypothetical protein [Klebsiella phage vB_KvaP_F5M1D]|nr:hypothetical protein [Klebsiella phage vB_KvaP_F5M1D]